jgi:type IV pilus biogenesis protein CpaD/CtpE
MKTLSISYWVCALVLASLLAGCASTDPGTGSDNPPANSDVKMNGYIDSSVKRKF